MGACGAHFCHRVNGSDDGDGGDDGNDDDGGGGSDDGDGTTVVREGQRAGAHDERRRSRTERG